MPELTPEIIEWIKAFHGSPHDFDKFLWDKIGSGEGAQVYSRGLYSAGKQDIAEWYRDQLSSREGNLTVNGIPFRQPFNKVRGALDKVTTDRLMVQELQDHLDSLKLMGKDTYSHPYRRDSIFNGKPLSDVQEFLEDKRADIKKLEDSVPELHREFEQTLGFKLPKDPEQIERLHEILELTRTVGYEPDEAWAEALENHLSSMPAAEVEDLDEDGNDPGEKRIRKQFDQLKPLVDKMKIEPTEGRLYEVHLNLQPHHMLNWDVDLDHEDQHPIVAARLRHMLGSDAEGKTGREIWKHLVEMHKKHGYKGIDAEEEAVNWLKRNGVHAMRYLDASSRTTEPPGWGVKLDGKTLEEHEHANGGEGSGIEDQEYVHLGALKAIAQRTKARSVDEMDDDLTSRINLRHTKEWGITKKEFEQYQEGLKQTRDWLHENAHRLEFFQLPDTRSFNYVVYDEDLMHLAKKMGMKGELLKDYGPPPRVGVTLKPVEHDPFSEVVEA